MAKNEKKYLNYVLVQDTYRTIAAVPNRKRTGMVLNTGFADLGQLH